MFGYIRFKRNKGFMVWIGPLTMSYHPSRRPRLDVWIDREA